MTLAEFEIPTFLRNGHIGDAVVQWIFDFRGFAGIQIGKKNIDSNKYFNNVMNDMIENFVYKKISIYNRFEIKFYKWSKIRAGELITETNVPEKS